jgi:hypothetical protein
VALLSVVLAIAAFSTQIFRSDKVPQNRVQLTAAAQIPISAEAIDVHFSGMLWDGHNDLPWKVKQEN